MTVLDINWQKEAPEVFKWENNQIFETDMGETGTSRY